MHCFMKSSAPSKKNHVQFGCTQFAKVNPRIPAYARGKGEHLSAVVRLLQNFIDQVWVFEEQTTDAGEITMPAAQHSLWEQWEVLDLRHFREPGSGKLWYSDEHATS